MILPLLFHPERIIIYSDSAQYNALAKNILLRHKFTTYKSPEYIPEGARTPMYPLFLATIYKIFHFNARWVLIFQTIIDTATIFLITLVPGVPLVSGFIYAFNLHQSLYTTQIMTDILFTFFIIFSFFYLVLYIKHSKKSYLIISGIIAGFASLTRPVGLYLPFIIAILIIVKKQKWMPVLFYIMVYLITLSPYIIRNKIVHHTYFLSTIGNLNLSGWWAAPTLARIKKIPLKEAQNQISEDVKRMYNFSDKDINEAGDKPIVARKFGNYALKFILHHPVPFLIEYIKGTIKIFSPTEITLWNIQYYNGNYSKLKQQGFISKFFFSSKKYGVVKATKQILKEMKPFLHLPLTLLFTYIFVFYIFIYIFAVKGAILMFKENRTLFYLIIIFIGYLIIFVGPAGSPRFRLPIEPFLSIFAARGIVLKN